MNERNGEKSMKNFSTNMALQDSLTSKKKTTNGKETDTLPKEILDKIKLIEKAFRK